MHTCASQKTDPQFCDFLESEFLAEQVEDMKEKSDMISKLQRVGPGVGWHMIDQELLNA